LLNNPPPISYQRCRTLLLRQSGSEVVSAMTSARPARLFNPARSVFVPVVVALVLLAAASWTHGATPLQFETSAGTLTIHPVGHGSLYLVFNDHTIHVDPFSSVADYCTLPKADQIWITHEHPDHLDRRAIE